MNGELCEISGFEIKVRLKNVLKILECREESPVYEEVVKEFWELLDEMAALAEPKGILGMTELPGSLETEKYKAGMPVIYAALSIGHKIKAESAKKFREGDYLKGMICDAIADDALFSMEERMLDALFEFCRERHLGISRRLEAPQDIPMEAQKEAWKFLELEKRYGIKISEGYMFDPVKTSCQAFAVSDDENQFRARHNCSVCSNITCKHRDISKVEVTVFRKEGDTESLKGRFTLEEGESVMEGLIRSQYYVNAPCGGKGRCGKCEIRLRRGTSRITPEDKRRFSGDELEAGFRLSCRAYPNEDVEIELGQNEEQEFEILSDGIFQEKGATGTSALSFPEEEYGAAIDIGTTTIAMKLMDMSNPKRWWGITRVNRQRRYGADVISRIKASVDGKGKELQKSIQKDLADGLQNLSEKAGISLSQVRRIVISGNTTMGHLLMGYPCSSLGVYPFTPVNIDFITGNISEMIGECGCHAQAVLLPGISAYVGGDMTAGLYAAEFDRKDEICLLVDLGTNGEIAIGNKNKILVASAAAGPAFEGGSITWGTGSVSGAICSVKLNGKIPEITTINRKAPVGICGTGVVETVYELWKESLIDETGSLSEEYFEEGFPLAKAPDGRNIVFTQKDVREFQLAKAAICAGVETALLHYGIGKDEVEKVYLAGGFGDKLDPRKALAIGIMPQEFSGKIYAVGNSSLAGAAMYLKDDNGRKRLEHMIQLSKEISLSSDRNFNEFYMEAMLF